MVEEFVVEEFVVDEGEGMVEDVLLFLLFLLLLSV